MTNSETERAFQEQVENHRKILFKICGLYCANLEDRRDLAQEILVHLWQAFPRYDRRRLFSTWMYRVGLNTAIDFCRRQSAHTRHIFPVEQDVLSNIPSTEPDTAAGETLRELLADLEPLQKALLMLHLEGKSYAEIADVLGISVTNVGTKLGRLKESLRTKYQKEGTR